MNIFNVVNFILICCVGVFLFVVLKDKEDAIEELYDMYYEHDELLRNKEKKTKKKKAKVISIDKRIY